LTCAPRDTNIMKVRVISDSCSSLDLDPDCKDTVYRVDSIVGTAVWRRNSHGTAGFFPLLCIRQCHRPRKLRNYLRLALSTGQKIPLGHAPAVTLNGQYKRALLVGLLTIPLISKPQCAQDHAKPLLLQPKSQPPTHARP